jgi:DNA-directed RNA polymerase specialized sigma24 family protein
VDQSSRLAERFEASPVRLRAVACRMLGPEAEADDCVQESRLRLSLASAGGVSTCAPG